MKTTAIIFSKDRTLQLKSLLLSIRANTDIPETDIRVIYKTSIPDISYRPLIDEFECVFVEQTSFLEDVKQVVADSKSDYLLFMVDDLIVARPFRLNDIERLMDARQDIDSFCLRMGKNIKTGSQPEFENITNGILAWTTDRRWGKHWNYFWDLSSSLYHRKLVEEYLSKCRPDKETFPNPFEDHFYQCMPNTKPQALPTEFLNTIRFAFKKRQAKIASYETSRCFTQGVNLVAEIDDERDSQFTPLELHGKMLEGYIVDFKGLADALPEQPNAGTRFFNLVKQ